MPRKPKKTQPKTPDKVQGRDFFQTPNYAVDLLLPFIPKNIEWIWEPASGYGKISKRLTEHKYYVLGTDLMYGEPYNFLGNINPVLKMDAIITNPPFSLKRQFYMKCLEHKLPFALLLPFDMCQWIAEAFDEDGIQALLPNRRIDYITPTGLSGANGHTSYYHSFWLTWGFNLPKQITVVELSLKEKKDNI
jgi:hypothetical protein